MCWEESAEAQLRAHAEGLVFCAGDGVLQAIVQLAIVFGDHFERGLWQHHSSCETLCHHSAACLVDVLRGACRGDTSSGDRAGAVVARRLWQGCAGDHFSQSVLGGHELW